MPNPPRCPKCNSQNVKWITMRRTVAIDVLQCKDCGTPIAEEDWQCPSLPMRVGRCINCGDARKRGVCQGCGLDQHEDVQVHDELRQVIDPRLNFMGAATEASRQGRRLLALKLATAAAAFDEDKQGDAARGMRIWLLSSIGDPQSAMEDAKVWVEAATDPSPVAWASLGQQYLAAGFPGSAADAFGKALAKDKDMAEVRAKRAQILLGMRREGQAAEEAYTVLTPVSVPPGAADIALGVMVKLAEGFESQLRDDEIKHLLTKCHVHVERSARLLTQRARLAVMDGDLNAAKRDLKSARALEPENPDYEKLQKLLKPQTTSWWRW